jgi:hypothetical protein
MRAKIAVDDDLGNVRQALAAAGYDVVNLEKDMTSADVVVVSGMTGDLAGYKDIRTEAAIVNAEGMSAASVVDEVRERLDRRQ